MKYCGGDRGVIIAVKTRRALFPSLLLSSIKHQLIYERPDREEGREGNVGKNPHRPGAMRRFHFSLSHLQERSAISLVMAQRMKVII